MKKNNRKNKDGGSSFIKSYSICLKRSPEYSKGYAILFAVVIIGIISMITIGLSNAAYKQLVLSSVARDSTTAFYQADIGSECALYVDSNYQDSNMETLPGFKCAGKVMTFSSSGTSVSGTESVTPYELTLESPDSLSQCFRITINKTTTTDPDSFNTTEIISRGYNICKKSNNRTVERGIRVGYGSGAPAIPPVTP